MCFWRAQIFVKLGQGSNEGGLFEETRRFVIIDDGVHVGRDLCGIAHTRGAIKQLDIRTVDAELSVAHKLSVKVVLIC
jgi:hypothetical protein